MFFDAFGDLHARARADPVRAGGDHFFELFGVADTARRLDAAAALHRLFEQAHVVRARARAEIARARFDERRARIPRAQRRFDHFVAGEQRRFDDRLYGAALRRPHDLFDLLFEVTVIAVFDRRNADDHVDLVRTVGERLFGFVNFCFDLVFAHREAHDARDLDGLRLFQVAEALRNIHGLNADRIKAVFLRLFAQRFDLLARRRLAEQGVVDHFEQAFDLEQLFLPFILFEFDALLVRDDVFRRRLSGALLFFFFGLFRDLRRFFLQDFVLALFLFFLRIEHILLLSADKRIDERAVFYFFWRKGERAFRKRKAFLAAFTAIRLGKNIAFFHARPLPNFEKDARAVVDRVPLLCPSAAERGAYGNQKNNASYDEKN